MNLALRARRLSERCLGWRWTSSSHGCPKLVVEGDVAEPPQREHAGFLISVRMPLGQIKVRLSRLVIPVAMRVTIEEQAVSLLA